MYPIRWDSSKYFKDDFLKIRSPVSLGRWLGTLLTATSQLQLPKKILDLG